MSSAVKKRIQKEITPEVDALGARLNGVSLDGNVSKRRRGNEEVGSKWSQMAVMRDSVIPIMSKMRTL